jgi:Zn-dependent peptidase ImmA (M78 family)
VRSLLDGNVVAVAEALRNLARQTEPPFSVPAILGEAYPDAVVTGHDLPEGIEELVTVTDDGVLVIYRREMSTAERRFAIAHAICHLLYDVEDGRLLRGDSIDHEREDRADDFAMELLAPDRLLISRIVFWPDQGADADLYADQVDRIAAHFHVPTAPIDKRIRELEQVANS